MRIWTEEASTMVWIDFNSASASSWADFTMLQYHAAGEWQGDRSDQIYFREATTQ